MPAHRPSITFDLEAEFREPLARLLERELAKEYVSPIKSKGKRLLDQALISIKVEGEQISGTVDDGRHEYKWRLTLPLYDLTDGHSYARCDCQTRTYDLEKERCAHLYAGEAALLQHLTEAALPNVADDWRAGFAHAAAQTSQPIKPEVESQIVWVLDPSLVPRPVLRNRAELNMSLGQKLPWSDFLARDELWLAPVDQLVAARVRAGEETAILSAKVKGEGYTVDAVGALLDLKQHGGIRFAVHGKIAPIRSAVLGLRFASAVQGFRVLVTLDGMELSSYRFEPGRGLIGIDADHSVVLVSRLSERWEPLVRRFIGGKETIPAHGREALFQYLASLESELRLDCEAIIPVSDQAPQNSYIMRLNPLSPKILKVELLVRPVPMGRSFLVGMGPDFALDFRDPKNPKQIMRDKNAELGQASRLVRFYELHGASGENDWEEPVYLLRDDRIFEFLAQLEQSAAGHSLSIEWPVQSKRLAVKPEAQGLPRAVVASGDKDWFSVAIEIDGEIVRLEEIIAAIKHRRRFIQLASGAYQRISNLYLDHLTALHERLGLAGREEIRVAHVVPLLSQITEEGTYELAWASQEAEVWQRYCTRNRTAVAPPSDLNAKLRTYQEDGVRWLMDRERWARGALLADDMGLGKTVQAIALLLASAAHGPSLVIAPTSLVLSWQDEIRKFAPTLIPRDYRTLRSGLDRAGPRDVVVASYGLILSDQKRFQGVSWNILILDEAQTLKNNTSKSWLSVSCIKARFTLGLSGTPIENNLMELWSIFHLLEPGLLGDLERFKEDFVHPIQLKRDESKGRLLKRLLKPFLLRRLKADYLSELPDKTEQNILVEMPMQERTLYEALRYEAIKNLAEKSDKQEADEQKDKQQILAALTRLRLCASHPKLIDTDWEGTSAKLIALVELVEKIEQAGQQALIFSQFVGHLDLIEVALNARHLSLGRLDGSMPAAERAKVVASFQRREFSFFLISLKAGGTGLNLTNAAAVIHMDPWWNPASEDQATDRAHRMGQKQAITIYRLVTAGTVEEKILKLHSGKRRLAERILLDKAPKDWRVSELANLLTQSDL